MYIITYL